MHHNSFSMHAKYDDINLRMEKDTVVKYTFTYSYAEENAYHSQTHQTLKLC